MQYRKVPKNGDELSVLGFGCMRLPERNGRIDVTRAAEQIRYAIDNGVNFIDTAMPYHYGASEPFLGKALSDGYREKVKVCTKLPPWSISKRDDMDRILDSQLKRLRVESVDYYLVHGLNKSSWERMINIGLLDFLDSILGDDRVKNIGFSFHDDIGTFKMIVDSYDWAACLLMYSFMDTMNQAGTEGVRYASSKDMAVFVMEPLRGGNLAGRVPLSVQQLWDSANIRRSAAEWALRWVWDHPEVTLLLSGMNDMGHIRENIRIADSSRPGSLTKEEHELIGKVREEYYSLMRVQCTGCRYCMPCPEGVDIPTCFETYNDKYLFGDKRARYKYAIRVGGVTGKRSNASMCTRCGKCLKLCPQSIQIPDLLEDVANEFEGLTFRPFGWLAKRYLSFQRWKSIRRAKKSIASLGKSEENGSA